LIGEAAGRIAAEPAAAAESIEILKKLAGYERSIIRLGFTARFSGGFILPS